MNRILRLVPLVLLVLRLASLLWRARRRTATGEAPGPAGWNVRGIRGATTVEEDTPAAIVEAVEELLREIVRRNDLALEDIASALFTATPDLRTEFPAVAARRLGWTLVPLVDAVEIEVRGKLPRCIRVLVHVNTARPQDQMVHVFLREASGLRTDLTAAGPAP